MNNQRIAQELVKLAKELTGAGFTKGFPEMTDDEWKALQKSQDEKFQRFEREKAEYRKRVREEWEEEDREWRERERRIRERIRKEMGR